MKKVLLFLFILLLIPYLLFFISIKENKIKFFYDDNLTIRVMRSNGVLETLPLEKYLIGVIAGEMPLSFSDEALKAQSVAARTYALKKINQNRNNNYDVVDTVLNQVYLDDNYLRNVWGSSYLNNINRLTNIVLSTEGEIMTYDNEIIDALYFSTSTGVTEDSEEIFGNYVPYLQSVSSNWDAISPTFNEVKKVNINSFFSYLKLDNNSKLITKNIEVTKGGRIKKISINNKEFSGDYISSLFGLRSNCFTISMDNENVIFTTKGYGHGVGMSQYGAEAMSRLGYTYTEILKYYYKNIEIIKM